MFKDFNNRGWMNSKIKTLMRDKINLNFIIYLDKNFIRKFFFEIICRLKNIYIILKKKNIYILFFLLK